jgi:hypothetical protein
MRRSGLSAGATECPFRVNRAVPVARPFGFFLSSNSAVNEDRCEAPRATGSVKEQQSGPALSLLVQLESEVGGGAGSRSPRESTAIVRPARAHVGVNASLSWAGAFDRWPLSQAAFGTARRAALNRSHSHRTLGSASSSAARRKAVDSARHERPADVRPRSSATCSGALGASWRSHRSRPQRSGRSLGRELVRRR